MDNTIKNTNYKIPIRYHLMFWVSYFSLNTVRWGLFFNDFSHSFRSNILEFIFHIIIVYFNIYYLIPKYILKKRYLTYCFLLSISIVIIYVLKIEFSLWLLYNSAPESDKLLFETGYSLKYVISAFMGEVYVVTFVSAIKLLIDWVYEKNRRESLQAVQLQTELQFLKAQIQPHFFFNTLNSLYALTLEKSKQAPEIVLKLSEIMEYVLYDAKEPKIRLLNEIRYIQNYIDLEKLRYGDKVNVQINLQGDMETPNVPPLLFLPFIENCFKHGAIENNKLNILIELEVTNTDLLKFSVTNNYNTFAQSNKTHGIGNQNVKRRLELLYKENFTLTTKTEKQNYIVNLTVQL